MAKKNISQDKKLGTGTGGGPRVESEYNPRSEKTQEPITKEMLNVDPETSEENVQELVKLCNEYRDVFAMNLAELGCTNLMKVHIKDTGEPVRAKPYRTSLKEQEIIKKIVNEWKEHGIVTETDSSYAGPALLVPRKEGEPRLVIDYRRLNNQTVKKNFPLASPEKHLKIVSGCNLFTTLDLAHGYLQISLSEDSKEKTAFITPDDTEKFERMMFGLTNAPYEFCRMMTPALGPLRHQVVVNYLDDLICPAES